MTQAHPQSQPIQPREVPQPLPVRTADAGPSPTQPVLRAVDAPLVPAKIQKGSAMKKQNPMIFVLLVVLVIGFGVGSGYALAVVQSGGPEALVSGGGDANLQREVETSEIKAGTKVGIADEKTFKDSAEGTLGKGGVDGEGSHHLTRPGGDSQTVYMTSSVIDLDQFDGRKVKIWGETISAKKAGWLMDVGKLEVLE